MQTRFLSARWQNLVVVNYRVDPGILEPYVPCETSLDLFRGECLVSLVAFQFFNTRVLGLPIPFHCNFEEINLRFYVQRTVNGETRHGVTFIKELVPKRAIAFVARKLYNENYHAVSMGHEVSFQQQGGSLRYWWQEAGADHSITATVSGGLHDLAAGSEEEFVLEHYWGYSAQPDGASIEYHVTHPPWRIWRAATPSIRCDFGAVYGAQFAYLRETEPHSCVVAEGSPIAVYFKQRVSRGQ